MPHRWCQSARDGANSISSAKLNPTTRLHLLSPGHDFLGSFDQPVVVIPLSPLGCYHSHIGVFRLDDS